MDAVGNPTGTTDLELLNGTVRNEPFDRIQARVNLADSLITVMDSSTTGTIWNSGNPHNKISISELAFKVKDLCGSKSEVIYVDPRDIYGPLYAEAFDKVPNITNIQETLNWIPKKSLLDVLNDVLSFYKGSEVFWESNRQDGESIDRMTRAAATAGKIGG